MEKEREKPTRKKIGPQKKQEKRKTQYPRKSKTTAYKRLFYELKLKREMAGKKRIRHI